MWATRRENGGKGKSRQDLIPSSAAAELTVIRTTSAAALFVCHMSYMGYKKTTLHPFDKKKKRERTSLSPQ